MGYTCCCHLTPLPFYLPNFLASPSPSGMLIPGPLSLCAVGHEHHTRSSQPSTLWSATCPVPMALLFPPPPFPPAGVSHGLGLCALALSRPGDVVVAECPTYFLVPPIFRDHHLTLRHVPTDQHGMDVEALEAWMREDPSHR